MIFLALYSKLWKTQKDCAKEVGIPLSYLNTDPSAKTMQALPSGKWKEFTDCTQKSKIRNGVVVITGIGLTFLIIRALKK